MTVLTESSTPVQFNISSLTGYSYIGTTTANAATFVSIPSSLQVRQSNYTYRHLGLHVTSSPSQPISVVVIGYTTTPRSTYLALPCHDQPTEEYIYYGISHESSESNHYSQILIVGCRDNTTVTITPTQMIQLPQDPQQNNSAIVTITAGTSHTVIIHTLQTLLIAAEFVDLTGTKVVSNYPLTVIGGHDCTNVPVSYLDCDPIATQSPPTINWGTQFLLIPLQSRNNGQMVKVISSENGTNVVIRCSEQSLNSNLSFAGNFISYYVGSLHYCHIQCSQPCYVAEVAFGREYNSYMWDGYGDPLIMTVPSMRQYIHSVTFTTLPEMPTNFFGIVVPADSYFNGTVLINDVLTTYDWTIIYNINGTISGYGYTTTANGNYTISHSNPNGKIYVSVYGFSHYGGYGYPAGMLLDILAVSRNSTQHVNSSSIYVTSSIFPAITTKDLANKQPSITRATVITTGKGILITTNIIIILRPTNNLKTEKASSTINIVSNIGLAIALLISIIVCSVVSILSYKAGVSRGRKQAIDGHERMTFRNPHYHPERDINSMYEDCIQNSPDPSNNQDLNSELEINSILEDNDQHVHDIAEPTPIDNTLLSQHQQNFNISSTEQEQQRIASQIAETSIVSPTYENLPIIIINQGASYPDSITEQSLLEQSAGETSSTIYGDSESYDISSRVRSCTIM